MRRAATRFIPALAVSLCALVIASLINVPGAVAARAASHRSTQVDTQVDPTGTAPDGCPNRPLPPPPVDTSEEPPPGSPSPEPLPIPAEPVGGPRMAECGIVTPDGAKRPPDRITAASWVIADLDSGAVLAAKDPHARERPASLIKILLALVVIRELSPDTVLVGNQADANQEGTKVGIGPGGEYTVEQLLDALIMRSGNDAAHILARGLGSVDTALDKMNALAKELGALDTRAATPSGLDGPGMTTSAYDQLLIFRAAMRHEEFATAAVLPVIDFPGHGTNPGFQVYNDNALLGSYPGFLGGKTGFTDDSKHTYVGAAERDGRRLAVVLLRGERNPGPLADQGARLLDFGFELASAAPQPVGQLVDGSPEAQPKQDSDSGETDAAPAQQDQSSQAADAERSMFGNVGLPLVLLAGVAMMVSVALWVRRRQARAARAAREFSADQPGAFG